MRTFSVVNLGCRVNRVESDSVESMLAGAGLSAVDVSQADIIVINTCAVTGAAEKKTRKTVRGALRNNDHAQVVVTGCASALSPETYRALSKRIKVVPKGALKEHLSNMLDVGDNARTTTAHIDIPVTARFRRGVKVQDGCGNRCAYCIVWKARGAPISVSPNAVMAEIHRLARSGIREVVLTGINLGCYRYGSVDLAGLLNRLLEEHVPCRFRLSSIEPPEITDDLIAVIASSDHHICHHLHVPLQSGSTKILHDMGRAYTGVEFEDMVARVRELLPMVSITTDVIAGLPGETRDDHDKTIALAQRCAFSKMHVFPYSRRAGTLAATYPDQVIETVKTTRARELRVLSDELRRADLAARAGTVELAVVADDGTCMTESYHELTAPRGSIPGSLIEVRL